MRGNKNRGGIIKMKRLITIILFSLCVSLQMYAAPSHIVTLFFEKDPATTKNTENSMANFESQFKNGIFVTYFGYSAPSDENGQVSFPRKHQNPKFSILVSNKIDPIFMLENTIHHWELKKDASSALYTVERKQDEKSKLFFWSVEKASLSKDNIIPLDTITIHAHPDTINIPTGITITSKSEQLLLPPVYVTSEIKLPESTLAFLQNSSFFSSVQHAFQNNKN